MSPWHIEQDGQGVGRIVRTALPRFSACWITGEDDEDIAALEGPVWSDSGSGSGGDTIHVYGFAWVQGAPDQGTFETLMREAVREIDAWIAGRL